MTPDCREMEELMPSTINSSLYYSKLKTKNVKKTKLLFHKIVEFHSHAILCSISPHSLCHLLPCHSLENLVSDDPLHPLRNRIHPFFHLDFYFLSICLSLIQQLLFHPELRIFSECKGCSLNLEMLWIVRKVWIASRNIGLDYGFFLLF